MKTIQAQKTKKVSTTIPMSKGTGELERCFDFFNKKLYGGSLPKPVITVQAAGQKNAYGWFCGNAWTVKKDKVPEINLCAEWLKRSINETMGTLLHEMVHLDNWFQDIVDCSSNQYHNNKFKVAAEKIGFEVEKLQRFGWAKTSLTPELEKLIQAAKPDAEILSIFRGIEGSNKKGKKGSKLKKWSCECTNIRVAVAEFSATCNNCGCDFQEME